MSHSLHALGTNGASLSRDRTQTSYCLIDGEVTFLIDAGVSALSSMLKIDAFKDCKELIIHLSHKHIDHIGGLFSLLQVLTWSDNHDFLKVNKVTIHSTKEVHQIISKSLAAMGLDQFDLKGYYPERNRVLELNSYPDEEDFSYRVGELEILSPHLGGVLNHGVYFSIAEKRILLTCDATEISDKYINLAKNSDIIAFDLGHLIIKPTINSPSKFDLHLDKVIDLLVAVGRGRFIATHLTLRHIEHKTLSIDEINSNYKNIISMILSAAKNRGFTGSLELGNDLDILF